MTLMILLPMLLPLVSQLDMPSSFATVTLRTANQTQSQIRFQAEIITYNDHRLVARLPGGNLKTYAPHDVLSVDIEKNKSHLEADLVFEKGDWAEAERLYLRALEDELNPKRLWIREELRAQLIKICLTRGDISKSTELFRSLYRLDNHTRFFHVIPLAWDPMAVPMNSEPLATRWMNDRQSAVTRLIGVSYLIQTPGEKSATHLLERDLTKDADPRIRSLARAQLWRNKITTASLQETRAYHTQVRHMPRSLRAGPYYLLGKTYFHLRKPQESAMAMLWIPLVYNTHPELASAAEVHAARSLRTIGQNSESVILLQEVLNRFQTTRASRQARKLLDNWKSVSTDLQR